MLNYFIRRCFYMIITILLISLISFILIQAPPGDFLTSRLQSLRNQYGSAADEQIAALRHRYGLNKPIYVQYYKWISGILLHRDFGISFLNNKPVIEIIKERLPPTLLITFLTLILLYAIAIPIGIYSAVKHNSIFDYLFTFLAFIGQATPNFLLALVLMYIFYNKFGWSMGGLYSLEFVDKPWTMAKIIDLLRHLILPIIVVGTAGTAWVVRVLRGTMLDELGKEYVQTARAKGLSERQLLWVHPFKVAILPLVSTIGWLLPQLVSGAVITSIVLNLPTTGATLFTALQTQDMYLAGSMILLLSVLTVIGTLVSDILLIIIDPRIRYD